MRIVYKLSSGAVMAAAQSLDGDQIIDPTAVAVWPNFNGSIHGSFTMPSGFPADISINPTNYQVDNPVSPTTVVTKFHIEVVPASTLMTADGVASQIVTINIKNSSDVLQSVSRTLNLSTSLGFLKASQLSITGGTGTVILYSSPVTGNAIVSVVDNDMDNTGPYPVFGTTSGNSPNIFFQPTATVQNPLAAVAPLATVVRSADILFSDTTKFATGLTTTDHGGLSSSNGVNGTFVRYENGAGSNNIQGIESTSMTQIWGVNFRSLYLRWQTESDSTGASYWIGMFNSSIAGSWVVSPTLSFGFRKFSTDTNFQAYVHDGTSAHVVDTGVPPTDTTLYEFKMTYDPVSGNVTFIINGTQVAQINVPGLTSSNFCGLACLARNENSNAHVMDMSAFELQYE